MTTTSAPPRATAQDGTYPRPQLLRARWADLCGLWSFAADPADVGMDDAWFAPGAPGFDATIQVPFPPESPASGIGATGFEPVVWYRRQVTPADLAAAGLHTQGDRVLLHFGAVDHTADVWLDGQHVRHHEGGQTPFWCDVTAQVRAASGDLTLVVRAQDDPHDAAMPRGKQDWHREPHSIWYDRTTGIWQPVWLEAVPRTHLARLAWHADVPGAAVDVAVRLSQRPAPGTELVVRIEHDGEVLAEQRTRMLDQELRAHLELARQTNGQQYEELLWSPDRPTLLDATVTVVVPGEADDVVGSYLGLRNVATGDGHLWLNDRPFHLRSVLEQGFWPQTHLAAPSADALRAEVQLIKDLGFNSARVHQKAEDPRFLFWADTLGLTLWAETANAYAFSPRSVELLTREWLELVQRDVSHPSIIAWVPLNESWGVQHGSHDVAQQHYGLGLAHLTRALDPSRPVISNDGWEHTDSDIWTVHDYAERGETLRARYGTPEAVARLLDGVGPAGRRMRLTDVRADVDRGQPVMLTEFGGVSYAADRPDAWGYSTARDAEDFEARVGELLDAVRDCEPLVGFCWTQLTDTGQETNGLLHADRSPKLPMETLRRLVTGEE